MNRKVGSPGLASMGFAALLFFACGGSSTDDSGGGPGDPGGGVGTAADQGSTGGSEGGDSGTSTTSGGSGDDSGAGTEASAGDSETSASSEGSGSDTGGPGGGDPTCQDCLLERCAAEYAACEGAEVCLCYVICIEGGGSPGKCYSPCDMLPPAPFEALYDCSLGRCPDVCPDVYDP